MKICKKQAGMWTALIIAMIAALISADAFGGSDDQDQPTISERK